MTCCIGSLWVSICKSKNFVRLNVQGAKSKMAVDMDNFDGDDKDDSDVSEIYVYFFCFQ